MSSSEAESMFPPDVNDGSSIPQLISVLRCSFQEKEYDEMEKLLIVRETRLQAERDNLRRDFNTLREKCEVLEKEREKSELNRLSAEQSLIRYKRDQKASIEKLDKLRRENKDLKFGLRKAERRYALVAEELKTVEIKKKIEGDKLAEELKKKTKEIDKLKKENDLAFDFLARVGERMSKLQEDIIEICGANVTQVRGNIRYEEVIGSIRQMSSLSDVTENLHDGADPKPLGSENADSGIEKLQDGSNEALQKMTVETLSDARAEVIVSLRSDSHHVGSPDEAFPPTSISHSDESWEPELNTEIRSPHEPTALLVETTDKHPSRVFIIISDSEDENFAAPKRRKIGIGGVSDDDDSSGSDLDVTCFEAFMKNEFEKFTIYKESAWKSAADMLSAFQMDYEPCMNAVCALYRKNF